LRGHRARARDPAHAADVRLQLRARHRARRRHGRARPRRRRARAHDRISRRRTRRRQCRRRLRRDRAHARDVQEQQGAGAIVTLPFDPRFLIQASYFAAALLFIFGLKRMSSPVTARRGIVLAGVGMVVATLITFLTPDMGHYLLMTVAIAIGGGIAWWTGKRVAMTDMPQMIALYNGMGGGAAG